MCEHQQGNFQFSERLKREAQALLKAAPKKFADCKPLNINRAIVGVLRALALDEAEGLLPQHDMVSNHKVDLEGFYKRLADLYPRLTTYRQQDIRDRFTLPSSQQQEGLNELLEKTAADPLVTAPELSEELRGTKAALDDAQKLSPTGTKQQQEANLVEPHMSAAAQVIPVWNWLANAREKFIKSGKKAEDVAKAIDAYQGLYKSLSSAKDYIEWLAGWFY